MSPYVRTVKTASGATAVQIVHSSRRGSRDIEHIGSAHDDAQVEVLKAAARQRLAAGQGELDLGLERTEPGRRGAGGGPLPITSSRMGHLLEALTHVYRVLGFERAAGGDEVFRQLVLARIIEPVSKLDIPAGAGGSRASRRPPTGPSRAACLSMRRSRGGRSCPPRAPRTRGWARRAWCSMTCQHPVFRDRCRGRVPGARVLQGTPPGAADHHRAAHRPGRVPADGQRVRGEHGRDQDDAAGHRVVHDRSPAARRDRRCRRGNGVGERIRRRSRPPGCRSSSACGSRAFPTWSPGGGASIPARRSPTGTSSPSRGPPGRTANRRDQVIYYQYRPTGPGGPCAASTSRSLRPSRPSPGRPRSSGTGSSSYRAAPRASTASSRRRPGPWPG